MHHPPPQLFIRFFPVKVSVKKVHYWREVVWFGVSFFVFLIIRISEHFLLWYFTIEFPFWSKNARSLSETQRGLSETQPGLSQTSNRLSENSLLLSERVIKLKNTYRKNLNKQKKKRPT
jgi:hypothetical protein